MYRGRVQYAETDKFPADAYSARQYKGIAFRVLGMQIDVDNEGEEYETGQVVARMVGDDRHHLFDESDLTPLPTEEFCPSCGQIGCGHGRV